MKKFKHFIIIPCVLAICLGLVSCANNKKTAFLDQLVLQNNSNIQNNNNNIHIQNELIDDSLSLALSRNENFFEGVYTSDGIIWHFRPDGSIESYDSNGVKYIHSYTLSHSGGDNINKYIEFTFPDGKKKYRFKKLTQNGFEVVHMDDSGNDSSIFAFTKSPFYAALFNSEPYFTETFYESNAVWNFKSDGNVRIYDVNGAILDYTYIIEYTKNGETDEKYMTITNTKDDGTQTSVRLRIVSLASGKFSAVKITNGVDSDVVTFTKQ